MKRAYVAMGANLANPHEQLVTAAQELHETPDVNVVARSAIYRSAPVGPAGQNDYLNAVLAVDTGLAPEQLLATLQFIEQRAGRVRGEHWGPRVLDLDLLVYAGESRDTPSLTLPHPRMEARNFVLTPLQDIVGDAWHLPSGKTLAEGVAVCPQNALSRTELAWTAQAAAIREARA